MDALVAMNLVRYPPIKEPPKIKPLSYQVHLFCKFYRLVGLATKESFHLKNIIHDLHDKGKFKFDHEVLDEVLQKHRAKVVQDGPVYP